jgi:hypothetical protein
MLWELLFSYPMGIPPIFIPDPIIPQVSTSLPYSQVPGEVNSA